MNARRKIISGMYKTHLNQRHAHSTKRAFNDTQALLLALTKCLAVIAAFSTLTNVWSQNMTYQCNRDLSSGGLDAERTKL